MFEKEPKTVADAFKAVSDSYTVTICRNGFVIEITGKNEQDDFITDRFIYNSLDQLKTAVQDIAWMKRV